MTIAFQAMGSGDSDSVIEFLSSNYFPFHVHRAPSAESVRMGVENGRFWNEDAQGYWIEDTGDRLGMVVIEDLRDNAPLFDMRLSDANLSFGASWR